MKYWSICFPGECGQLVKETWSEDQIFKSSYYKHWIIKMVEANKHEHINNENFIDDWVTIHWAIETDQYGTPVSKDF